jgi:FkbM family methyltransferase
MGALDIYSTPFGRFLLDPDDGVQAHLAFSGTPWDAWILPLIEKYAPGQLCFDVGAHVGQMSMLMARAGAKAVKAYEPQDRLWLQLAVNVEMNPGDVEALHYAVWDQPGGRVGIADHPNNKECSPGGIAFSLGNVVCTTTIDVEAGCYGYPGFIKIDAQGADLLVLKGGIKTLDTARPVVIFEYEENLARDLHGHEWSDYVDLMSSLDYSLTEVATSNFLALPKEV